MVDTKNQSIKIENSIRETAQAIGGVLLPAFESMKKAFINLRLIIEYFLEHKEEIIRSQIDYLLGDVIELINTYSKEISDNNFLAAAITRREIESHLREIHRLEYLLYQELNS